MYLLDLEPLSIHSYEAKSVSMQGDSAKIKTTSIMCFFRINVFSLLFLLLCHLME